MLIVGEKEVELFGFVLLFFLFCFKINSMSLAEALVW